MMSDEIEDMGTNPEPRNTELGWLRNLLVLNPTEEYEKILLATSKLLLNIKL
jgi:hypothetical protein